MNIEELNEVLKIENVPSDLYSLKGGMPNESYCIGIKEDKWEVYYSERGCKSDLKVFETEEKACQHLYKRIKRML